MSKRKTRNPRANINLLIRVKNTAATPLQFRKQLPKIAAQSGSASVLPGKLGHSNLITDPLCNQLNKKTAQQHFNGSAPAVNKLTATIKAMLANLSGPILDVFQTQYLHGLRASEVLNIRNKHFMANGLIFIPGLKHSNDRFINSPDLIKWSSQDPAAANYLIFNFTYATYYKALVSHGFTFTRSFNAQTQIVSHALRKNLINNILEKSSATQLSKLNYTGHKTNAGYNYYVYNNKA